MFIVRGQINYPSLWLMCVLCKAVEGRHEEITSSAKLWPQMKERQSERVRWMSTFRRTNGMSVKRWYTDAFSPERQEMLSGDAALLFQPYSGCTGNILSFYPSTSPRSISDPLTINDFFLPPPQVCLLQLFLAWVCKFLMQLSSRCFLSASLRLHSLHSL